MKAEKKVKVTHNFFARWFNNNTWARGLLEETPHELKEGLSRAKEHSGSALEFLLKRLEEEARRSLRAHLPVTMTEDLDMSDLLQASNEPESYLLNYEQENAIAVLTMAFSIRLLLEDLRDRDPWEVRSEAELGEQIALKAMQLGWAAVRGDFWTNLWPRIEHGLAFREGPKHRRSDNLNREIYRLLENKPKLRAKEIWALLERLARSGDKFIIEVTYDEICWKDKKDSERSTAFKSFQNRVSAIKKRLKTPAK